MVYITTFLSILSLAFTIYVFLLNKKIDKRTESKVEIRGQRERIESSLYSTTDLMMRDPERFFDNSKLLLEFPDIELSVNAKIPNYSFFTNMNVNVNNVDIKRRQVFCLMPFNKRFDKTYDSIKKACENSGFVCVRSDENYAPGNVLKQILSYLLESELIIAVLDGKNPNVFYEIGIAHSIGKTVLLIANMENADDVSFDLRSQRLILYSNQSQLIEKLSLSLKHIENVHS